MRRMRFLPVLLAAVLAAAPGAMVPAQDPPEPPPAETPEPAPAEAPPAEGETPDTETLEAAADEAPPADDEAEGDDEDEPKKAGDKTQATIKIETDLECMVTVGVQPAQEVLPGEPLTVKVDPGPIEVRASASEAAEAALLEQLVLEAGDRERIRFKMAKALADLRKIEARDRTYRDRDSRLMWPTRDNGIDLDWEAAGHYCDELKHGGWEDWRLPSLEELEGIEAMWSLRPYKTADPIALTSCCPWSSDRIDEENAWNFNYRFRKPFRGHVRYSYNLRALCVRDGSDEIPENTRRARREAKRLAKEQKRERLARQAEREAAARAAAEAAAAAEKDGGEPDDGGGGGGRRL